MQPIKPLEQAMNNQEFHDGAKLIFVGGSPRSGTTLMQNMLDSHPEIAGGPEYDNIPYFLHLRAVLHGSIDKGRTRVFADKETVSREIGFLIERLLQPYMQRQNKRLLSEKTPWNVLHFIELLEIFPAARFIFCIRDPRAVLSSLLQVGKREKNNTKLPDHARDLRAALALIKQYNNAGFNSISVSPRVLLVRYEDLVTQPEQETKRLCAFLETDWNSSMLQSGKKKHDGESVLDNVWYTREMYKSDPDPDRMEKWKHELTPYQQAIASLYFSTDQKLNAQGYDFNIDHIPAIPRLIARIVHESRAWWTWRMEQLKEITNRSA